MAGEDEVGGDNGWGGRGGGSSGWGDRSAGGLADVGGDTYKAVGRRYSGGGEAAGESVEGGWICIECEGFWTIGSRSRSDPVVQKTVDFVD